MNKGLTTTEAAERLGISSARVRRLVLDGRLPAEKFGRDIVIYETDVKAFERLKGGRPPKTKSGKTTHTPHPPEITTTKQVLLRSEAKKGGKK